jgi:WD40 repeat protein
MAKDGKRFIGYFGESIVQSAPHIYISALALSPCHSWIFKQFQKGFANILTVEIGQLTKWPATFAVLEGHTGGVTSVSYSPDVSAILI